MQELTGEMENRILDAATRVFVRKGKAGSSMQDIAEEAGINRPLLNYYFRSKEKLFDLVFTRVFVRFLPEVARVFNAELPVKEKLSQFIDTYFEMLTESPLTPVFILNEISTNPETLVNTIKRTGVEPQKLFSQIEHEMGSGLIRRTDPRQLITNLLALIIFPFAARPMLEALMFNGSTPEMEKFMKERKAYVKTFFLESIHPDHN